MPNVKLKLTKRSVDALQPGAKRATYYDTELRGLGLRLEPSGRRVLFVEYRTGGRGSATQRYTIGEHGAVSIEGARKIARKILGRVADGEDPQRERVTQRRAPKGQTVADAIEAFLEARSRTAGDRTVREYRRDLERELVGRYGRRPLSAVNRSDLVDALEKIAARAPVAANRCRAALSTFFRWAVATGRLQHSPLDGVPRPARETPRERVLEPAELRHILLAAQATPWPFGPLVRLLALTLQRRQEVGSLRWEELDLDAETWLIPSPRSKNRRAHVVHLAPQAVEILQAVPRIGPVVFSASADGFSGWSKAKAALDVRIGEARAKRGEPPMEAWRLHDLRRTAATYLAATGHAPHVVDRILNHVAGGALGGVAAVYNRHQYLAERQAALGHWAEWVSELTKNPEQAFGAVPSLNSSTTD